MNLGTQTFGPCTVHGTLAALHKTGCVKMLFFGPHGAQLLWFEGPAGDLARTRFTGDPFIS
jgi:hypothetical protein